MTELELEQIIDAAIARTGHERLRYLCLEHPDARVRQANIANAHRLARAGNPPHASTYPPLATQAVAVLKAAGRVAHAAAHGQPLKVEPGEAERRREICLACEHHDAATERCRKCACYLAVKTWLKTEECPLGKWETPTPTPRLEG